MDSSFKEKAIIATNVTKSFVSRDVTIEVLKGIDLSIDLGKIVMITGSSGCGKTTLLSILSGTLQNDTGAVYLFGKSLKGMSEDEMTEFRKKEIGFVFQNFNLIQTLSVAENVSVPLILLGHSYSEAQIKAKEMLSMVGLMDRAGRKTGVLSGGEQQRVAIARALIHQPRLVICDEPTASLDSNNSDHIMQLLIKIAKSRDRSVLIVTHSLRILKYADSIVHLEDGVVVRQ